MHDVRRVGALTQIVEHAVGEEISNRRHVEDRGDQLEPEEVDDGIAPDALAPVDHEQGPAEHEVGCPRR